MPTQNGVNSDDFTRETVVAHYLVQTYFGDAPSWGQILGTLADQADLAAALAQITTVDAAADATTWLVLAGSQTGAQNPLTDAGLTYNASTDTLGVGNIIGTALGMTIQPRAPTVLENPEGVFVRAQNATKANTNGGSITIQSGSATGTGIDGAVSLSCAVTGVTLTLSQAGVSFFGLNGVSFNSVNDNWIFQGPGTPPTDTPLQFIAGINVASTGCTAIEFSTDSGIAFTVGETVFGTQEIAFFGVALTARPTTAGAASTFVAGAGVPVTDTSTFDGYTLRQIARAVRTLGLLT